MLCLESLTRSSAVLDALQVPSAQRWAPHPRQLASSVLQGRSKGLVALRPVPIAHSVRPPSTLVLQVSHSFQPRWRPCRLGANADSSIACDNCSPGKVTFSATQECRDCEAGTRAVNNICETCPAGSVAPVRSTSRSLRKDLKHQANVPILDSMQSLYFARGAEFRSFAMRAANEPESSQKTSRQSTAQEALLGLTMVTVVSDPVLSSVSPSTIASLVM